MTDQSLEFEDGADARHVAWRDRVIERFLRGADPQDHPTSVIVAGQPGAGKGVIVEHVSRLMVEQGYCVVVDPEELKYFHPAYAACVDRDDRQVMMEIGSQIWQAADALISAAVERRAHIVIATHFAQPVTATELVSQLRRSSYHVTVVALCAEPEASWRGVQERLDRQQQAFEVGTWVDREYHDACCCGLVDSLEVLQSHECVDELFIVSRDGDCLLSRTSDTDVTPIAARQLFPWVEADPLKDHEPSVNDEGLLSDIAQDLAVADSGFPSEDSETGASPPPSKMMINRGSSQSGGRKIKLGVFTVPGSPSGLTADPEPPGPAQTTDLPSGGAPSRPRENTPKPRKVKIGSFPSRVEQPAEPSPKGDKQTHSVRPVPALPAPAAPTPPFPPPITTARESTPPAQVFSAPAPNTESHAGLSSAYVANPPIIVPEDNSCEPVDAATSGGHGTPVERNAAAAPAHLPHDSAEQREAIERRLELQEKLRRKIQDRG